MQRFSLLTSSGHMMFFAHMKIGVCVPEYVVKNIT